MLCCVVLCYVVLCGVLLCFVVLCCVVLSCVIWCIMLCYVVLCCVVSCELYFSSTTEINMTLSQPIDSGISREAKNYDKKEHVSF